MKKCLFTGACTALVTPFIDNQVNYPMLEMLIRHQIDSGIHTVVISGTTGEAPTLTDQEKIAMVSRCKSYAGDDCMIIVGTGSNSTEHAVRLSEEAEQAGADGLLIVTPYYNKANSDGLYVHYWTIAQHTDLPIILYNVPSRTGVDIPISVYRELSKISNIAGVKEAGGDIRKTTYCMAECDLPVWSGCDELTVPMMAIGARGVISVLSNVFPKETSAVCGAALAGNYPKASSLMQQLLPAINLLFCEVNPIPVKYAMKLIGFDCGPCRLPLTKLSEGNRQKIEAFFKK